MIFFAKVEKTDEKSVVCNLRLFAHSVTSSLALTQLKRLDIQ